MSNNTAIEMLKEEINRLEMKAKLEQDVSVKIKQLEEIVVAREKYTKLLVKKRPMLLTLGLVFCIFYGISLMICLPPYIVRGKKRDINEERIRAIKVEIDVLRSRV